MIITRLAVEGVGRFRSRHVVQGLGPGLNLLCAPNEAGKSTLFRALQAALFARHGSKTEELRRLGCLDAEVPASIEVGFRRGEAEYLVRKSFLRGTGAKLSRDGSVVAEGRAADEKIWELLDLAPGASIAEPSTFGLLWVPQAKSFDAYEPSPEAKALLGRVIEAEVGQVLGGERGERVLRSVCERLAREATATGQPKAGGPWRTAIERRDAAKAELAALQATMATLEADRAALAGLLRQREALSDTSALAAMRADLATAAAERDAAARADHAAQQAETEQAQRELTAERARKRHEELVGLDQRIARRREQIAALDRQLAEQTNVLDAQATVLSTKEQALANLAAKLSEAERAADRARRREASARDAEHVEELSVRLTKARRLRDDIARVKQAIERTTVPMEAVKAIETARRALEAAEARREAKAPRVIVRPRPAGAGKILCDGAPVTEGREVAATAPLLITVADLAEIEIKPAASPDDDAAVEIARENLAKALRTAGVASLAEAQECRAKAADLEAERRGLLAELSATAPAVGKEDGIAALERQLATAKAALDALTADTDRAPDHASGDTPGETKKIALPDRETLARERIAAEAACDLARHAHRTAQEMVSTAREQVAATRFMCKGTEAQIAEANRALRDGLVLCPDAERADRLTALAAAAGEARVLFEAAREKAAALRAAVPTAEVRAATEARVKRLTGAIETNERRLGEVERDIAALQGRIATRGGEGLGEREAEAVDALALAESELARTDRRVAALKLLKTTIEESRQAAADQFLAPVKTAMRPYLHALFPGADAALDPRFGIDGISRGAAAAIEPFVSLSDGTREQVAIIVRLALGRLLAERGNPVPVVLDDALVFSDDDRIERMFDVLTRAAEKQQVIVLTCRSRAFLTCGGRPLSIVPEDLSSG
ncbi:DNA double-strand break repair Rad50 ATPase [Rhodovulum sp. PH10]|uniref:AAA family ATPase n=1 Tax=Rhodovulum sp. PH10 TaxID=1187851 RepID=UPI00027C2C77|nr:AAA family ATPase [Rhodovulum sp. PH10]EJW10599.1 DNA double-strand break repair Rad50 ATPase [Rhodovulum sp. PH10]